MNNNILVIGVVALVIGAGAGFFGGMQYQKMQTPARGQSTFNNTARRTGGGAVRGQVLSVDNNTMTVKLPDGSSKIVILSGSTTINKATQATTADITTGAEVTVFGTTNSDGSVTAQNVQIGTLGNFRGQGGTPSGQQTNQPLPTQNPSPQITY